MNRLLTLATLVWCCIAANYCYAFQNCSSPLISLLDNNTATTIDIGWIDFNSNTTSVELEYLSSGLPPTSIPSVSNISTTEYTVTGLEPGNLYDLYIRSICTDGESDWNGPFSFNTNLNNSNFCELYFPISDKNCPTQDEFTFENNLAGNLGEDLFLDGITVTINHSWPADLQLSLESPNGVTIDLIQNQGINSQDIGIIDVPCEQTLVFSDRSCESILSSGVPIIGNFKSLNPISDFYDLSEGAGNWVLKICDRAEGDIGELVQFNLVFSQGICYPPEEIRVLNIGGDFVEFEWENPSCSELEIVYGPLGFSADEARIQYIDCIEEFLHLDNLDSNTEYEFYFNTLCVNFEFDAICGIEAKTDCANPSLTNTFDLLTQCEESCNLPCILGSNVWINVDTDSLDWIVNEGQTGTPFTGPEQDVQGGGKYLFVDSPTNTCGSILEAQLISSCLSINTGSVSCDMSFYYQMNGIDVNSLTLEISIDNGDSYTELWSLVGDQGAGWDQVLIDLSSYSGQIAFFRFTAISGNGDFGDIALDDIKFYGSTLVTPDQQFFIDEDGDGFGNSEVSFFSCLNILPAGFVSNDNDCDDTNAEINPESAERPCNLIDENCNGQLDEMTESDFEYDVQSVDATQCAGLNDGSIELRFEGGASPYKYEWTNGSNENPATNLNAGVYQCTVTDNNGCKLITEFINVNAIDIMVYVVQNITNASCEGMTDGSIQLEVGGGEPPYSYCWSDESKNEILFSNAGLYIATVTDALGCELITDEILIRNDNLINTGVLNKNNISCNLGNDGSILVGSNSGESPYSYIWNDGITGSSRENLEAGYYSYTVEDALGCQAILDSIQVEEPNEFELLVDRIEGNVCALESEGRIEISASGGQAPYSFRWSNGEFSDDIGQLPNGTYNLTVTDFNACMQELSNIVISSPPEITIQIDSLRDETCQIGQNGYLSIIPSGGSGIYAYNWSKESNNYSFVDSLESGIYSVTVTDGFGCKTSFTNLEIGQNELELDVFVEVIQDLECNNSEGAIIRAFIYGGTGPYDFNWSNGEQGVLEQNFSTLSDLGPGNYSVNVIDALGCLGASTNVTIAPSGSYNYWIDSLHHNNCFGEANGEIFLDIQGEGAPFTFSWSHGALTQNATDLPNGTYKVTIADNMGCPLISESVNINSPPEILFNGSATDTNIDSNEGTITLNPSGGVPPYELTFQQNEQLGISFEYGSLSVGNYDFMIEDQNGCVIDTSIIVDLINATNTIDFPFYLVYPNPSKGQFFVEGDLTKYLTEDLKSRIYITNVHGQNVRFESTFVRNQLAIKLIAPPGIYFLNIPFEKTVFSTKLIIY